MNASIRKFQEKLRGVAGSITENHTIQLRIPPEQSQKLQGFLSERNILAMTPVAEAAFTRAVQRGVNRGIATHSEDVLEEGLYSGAQELKRLYTERFLASGGDVALKALSRAWAIRKRRKGLDPRIGVATGALVRAISQSTINVR